MKKILSILLMLAASYSISNAQADAGQIVLGGAVGFSSEKTKTTIDNVSDDSDPTTNLTFSPRGGYFLSEDMEVGVRLGYNSSRTGDTDFKVSTTNVSVGPYIRKYFELADELFVYGQGAIAIGWGKMKSEGGGTTVKEDLYDSFSLGVSPGLMYRVGGRVAIELSTGLLRYSTYTNNDPAGADKIKTSKFGLNLDLRSLNLGVNIFL